jgi:hypothetical protein
LNKQRNKKVYTHKETTNKVNKHVLVYLVLRIIILFPFTYLFSTPYAQDALDSISHTHMFLLPAISDLVINTAGVATELCEGERKFYLSNFVCLRCTKFISKFDTNELFYTTLTIYWASRYFIIEIGSD